MVAVLEAEQERWFLWLPVFYGGGVAFYFSLHNEPPLLLALMVLVLASVIKLLSRRGTLAVVTASVVLAASIGFAVAKLSAELVAAPALKQPRYNSLVRGWVELIEPRSGPGNRLTVRVQAIEGVNPAAYPRRVRITTRWPVVGLSPGDPIRLRATLSPPPKPAMPGAYDFARAAYFRGLGAVGYARSKPAIDQTAGEPPLSLRVLAWISRLRQRIGQRVRNVLEGQRGAIAQALITGERGGISAEINEAYRDSGIFHILSISGLHMTIMAGTVFFAMRFGLAAIPAVALRYPIKKLAALTAAVAALAYLVISGAALPTVRAWVMTSIMFLAVLMDRPALALRNVALSAFVVLIAMPESLLNVGFQMSYAAVVALVAGYEAIRRHQRAHAGQHDRRLPIWAVPILFLGGIILTTVIASLAVAPIAAYHFHRSQQFAVLANLLVVPVCNLVVLPAALASLLAMPVGLDAPALWLMGAGIDLMTWCAHKVAALPGAVLQLPAFSPVAFVTMVIGGLWLCLWQTRLRLLGLAGIAAGLAIAPFYARPDILVGRDGALVAIRGGDGTLRAMGSRRDHFELERWLEHDGDARAAKDVVRAGGFRCDAVGCTAWVKHRLVAIARAPAALAEDCQRAAILIMRLPRPRACRTRAVVIDLWALRDHGAHAVYLDATGTQVVSVAAHRGQRPWAARPRARARVSRGRPSSGSNDVASGAP